MEKVMKALRTAGKALNVVSVTALVVMVCITVADIFLKKLFKAPITGAVEITRMMMVCMTPSFVSALIEHRHVSVGLFVDRLGRKGQIVFDCFGYLLASGLCGLMCYQGFIDMGKKIAQKQVYTMLKMPTWPFYLIFAIAMGFFAVSIFLCLINKFVDKSEYVSVEAATEKDLDGGETV